MTHEFRLSPDARVAPPPPRHGAGGSPLAGLRAARGRLDFRWRFRIPRASPVVAILAGVGVVAMGVVLWQAGALRSAGPGAQGVPLVAAPASPFRLRAEDPSPTPGNERGSQIYERAAGRLPTAPQERVERLVPPPETPLPLPARLAAPRPALAPVPAPAAAVMPAPAAAPLPVPAPASAPPAPPPAAAPAGASGIAAVLPPLPPAALGRPAPEGATAVAPAPLAVSAPASAAAGYASQIQLGAVNSEADARREWDRLRRSHADLLGRLRPSVSAVEANGRTLWRLRAGSFADRSAALDLCAKLRSRGATCLVPQG